MAFNEKKAQVFELGDEASGSGEKVNLTDNVSARIRNPLADRAREELYEDVDTFCAQYGLKEISDVVRRGALVAQAPADFEKIPGLQDDERVALRDEVVHKWR